MELLLPKIIGGVLGGFLSGSHQARMRRVLLGPAMIPVVWIIFWISMIALEATAGTLQESAVLLHVVTATCATATLFATMLRLHQAEQDAARHRQES